MMSAFRFGLAVCLAIPLATMARTQEEDAWAFVELNVEGRGRIVLQIFKKEAPQISAHFLQLVDEKFYDRQLFHRKVPNFVIQAGDPDSKKLSPAEARRKPGEMGGTAGIGDGGSGKKIAFEINNRQHAKHFVGMALEAPASDTGDSQFFINLKDNFRLNGQYVVFGKVVRGSEIVDAVERGDRITRVKKL